MGKPTGFQEWPRQTPARRDPHLRLADSREVYLPLAPEHARRQAGRCMDCGVPFCHQGCPLGNLIPDWNDLVFRDRWEAAYRSLASTNDFPEFTGRLCPAPCEASCVLAIDGAPVTIEHLEREIVERAFEEGWVRPRVPAQRTGKRVAVVGSGPAGLAAASQLNQAGHAVTVFERASQLGGLLRLGIPDFKMEKGILDRRIALLEAEGIVFRTGVDVGRSPTWSELRAGHDALVLALGATRPRELDVPGRALAGVVLAMDYLSEQNERVAGRRTAEPRFDAKGKRVIILGGGDTGSDCLGTALRQGAASARQIELLPAPPSLRAGDNPWPQWPLVFRTSSSQEEGGQRDFGLLTRRLSGRDDRLEALHAVRVEVTRDAAGRATLCELDEETTEPVDLVVLALGFVGPEAAPLSRELGVALDVRGNVQVAGARTNVPGIYGAGDASRGASLIVWAISDGREAARAVDADLAGRGSYLPTRGRDLPFGGR